MASSPSAIKRHFGKLRDPRVRNRSRHLLIDIIVIAICAVIARCDDWQEIVLWAQLRQDWLRTFLRLPNGIPSHDTFERVFDQLDPQAFQACFRQWIAALSAALDIKHIAIDGKTLRGSGDRSAELKPLHLVSAWASEAHLSLGQVAVDSKSNEITAIPELLQLLDLKGALITIDAMGCQKEIAEKVVTGGGDFILTVKDNQPRLLEDIQAAFTRAFETDFAGMEHDSYIVENKGHGRVEKRCYTILTHLEGIRDIALWMGLKVIGICTSERTVNGKTTVESRYFIGSKKAKARYYGKGLRGHWGIENNLHWQLDVTFGEDDNRVSRRRGAENLAVLRRLALGLLKRHPAEESIAKKRLLACLSTDFLAEVLQENQNLENV
jgi:predicted transposase YbfD/YdcC